MSIGVTYRIQVGNLTQGCEYYIKFCFMTLHDVQTSDEIIWNVFSVAIDQLDYKLDIGESWGDELLIACCLLLLN